MEVQVLFNEAREYAEKAINLGIKIKEGDIELSIAELMEAFVIVYGHYALYRREFDEVNDDYVRAEASRWIKNFMPLLDGFNEIFYDFELEIIRHLKSLRKSQMSEAEQKNVETFLKVIASNQYLTVDLRQFQLAV